MVPGAVWLPHTALPVRLGSGGTLKSSACPQCAHRLCARPSRAWKGGVLRRDQAGSYALGGLSREGTRTARETCSETALGLPRGSGRSYARPEREASADAASSRAWSGPQFPFWALTPALHPVTGQADHTPAVHSRAPAPPFGGHQAFSFQQVAKDRFSSTPPAAAFAPLINSLWLRPGSPRGAFRIEPQILNCEF